MSSRILSSLPLRSLGSHLVCTAEPTALLLPGPLDGPRRPFRRNCPPSTRLSRPSSLHSARLRHRSSCPLTPLPPACQRSTPPPLCNSPSQPPFSQPPSINPCSPSFRTFFDDAFPSPATHHRAGFSARFLLSNLPVAVPAARNAFHAAGSLPESQRHSFCNFSDVYH